MRPLAFQALIYGAASAAGSVANLLLLPLYGHALAPSEYGRLETLVAAQQILLVFCAGGLGSALFGVACDLEDPADRRRLAAIALRAITWLALGVASLAAVLAPFLADLLRGADPWAIRLICLQAAGNAIAVVPLATLRAQGHAMGYAFLSVGQALATAALAALAVAWFGWGVTGILGAGALVGCLIGAGTWIWYGTALRGKSAGAAPDELGKLLSLGALHVPSSVAAWVTLLADRYLLLWLAGTAEVGLYAMGCKLGNLASALVVSPLALAWPAHLGRLHREADTAGTGRACAAALETALLWALGIGMAAFLLAPELLALVARSAYRDAAPVVGWIALGNAFAAAYPVLLSGINLAGRYHLYPLLTGVAALANLGLNALLIPRHGAAGAAAATAAAFLCQALLAGWLSQRLRPVPYEWSRLARIGALAAAAALPGVFGAPRELRALALAAFLAGAFGLRPSGRRGAATGLPPAPGAP